MDVDDGDALVSVAAFTDSVRLLGSGRGGKAKDETLKGIALEGYEHKRARKGKLVAGMKVQRALAGA
jgi:topoisomerase-4 subunit A